MADHRRTTGHVRKPPHTVIGEEDTETGGDESLGDIADEDRHRRHPPHGLPRVPETGVSVADVTEIDRRTACGNQVCDGDRTEQVPDDHHDENVDRCRGEVADCVHW